MKVPEAPGVGVMMFLHNHGALVPSIARIFGSDFSMIFVDPAAKFKTHTYEVSRVNITELDNENSKCSDYLGPSHENPGLVMSSDGPKTVEKCILDYYHKNLNCQLPWG